MQLAFTIVTVAVRPAIVPASNLISGAAAAATALGFLLLAVAATSSSSTSDDDSPGATLRAGAQVCTAIVSALSTTSTVRTVMRTALTVMGHLIAFRQARRKHPEGRAEEALRRGSLRGLLADLVDALQGDFASNGYRAKPSEEGASIGDELAATQQPLHDPVRMDAGIPDSMLSLSLRSGEDKPPPSGSSERRTSQFSSGDGTGSRPPPSASSERRTSQFSSNSRRPPSASSGRRTSQFSSSAGGGTGSRRFTLEESVFSGAYFGFEDEDDPAVNALVAQIIRTAQQDHHQSPLVALAQGQPMRQRSHSGPTDKSDLDADADASIEDRNPSSNAAAPEPPPPLEQSPPLPLSNSEDTLL
jgi:hypothetical protein